MNRRNFLKLVGVVLVAPSLPLPAPHLESGEFIYRGYKFVKSTLPQKCNVTQLYLQVGTFRIVTLIEPEYFDKCRNMYCDSQIRRVERYKTRIKNGQA